MQVGDHVKVPAARYTQHVTTRYDDKCYNGGYRSSVAYKFREQRRRRSCYTCNRNGYEPGRQREPHTIVRVSKGG